MLQDTHTHTPNHYTINTHSFPPSLLPLAVLKSLCSDGRTLGLSLLIGDWIVMELERSTVAKMIFINSTEVEIWRREMLGQEELGSSLR